MVREQSQPIRFRLLLIEAKLARLFEDLAKPVWIADAVIEDVWRRAAIAGCLETDESA